MSLANLLSALLAAVAVVLIACHFVEGRRPQAAPQDEQSRRRARLAWEVRALVVGVTGPCAAGIYFGYLSREYALPLVLFLAAGFIAAAVISPADEGAR